MKILIIEDDLMISYTLEFRLKKDGYEVTTARDGREAIEKLQSGKFNLVTTDLMLPFVTGLEVLSYVKLAMPELPIIVLSGDNAEGTVSEALKLGADDYLEKPFNPSELSQRVKRLLVNASPVS
ncbi:MAG: response regulator [Cytophagales bacterium CG18_big_fil_WC_8_21_14_2_50_42_9]|nr:MAG: response regulator [Cytophagales bacterium CG18_big_fil_WC_8_21_14_2_50_42_9]